MIKCFRNVTRVGAAHYLEQTCLNAKVNDLILGGEGLKNWRAECSVNVGDEENLLTKLSPVFLENMDRRCCGVHCKVFNNLHRKGQPLSFGGSPHLVGVP